MNTRHLCIEIALSPDSSQKTGKGAFPIGLRKVPGESRQVKAAYVIINFVLNKMEHPLATATCMRRATPTAYLAVLDKHQGGKRRHPSGDL